MRPHTYDVLGVTTNLLYGKCIILAAVFFLWYHHFNWAVVRTFVAMGYNKTYAGVVNLHKDMKDSRHATSVKLWSSVLCDSLLYQTSY